MIIRINNLDAGNKTQSIKPTQEKQVTQTPQKKIISDLKPKTNRMSNRKLITILLVVFFGIIGLLFAIDNKHSHNFPL